MDTHSQKKRWVVRRAHIPPAEAEEHYYAMLDESAMAA
jgi:hypothetical protein